jgi:trehalose 6-phosphate phosphatase
VIHILSEEGMQAVRRVAESRALLAFDFDGTLAPIVEDRHAAALRPETLRLLRTAALLYPCAVISGRSRADVATRVSGVPVVAVVGNHGTEAGYGPVDESLKGRMRTLQEALVAQLSECQGLEIEDKGYSIAIHFRRAPDPGHAERCIHAAVSRLGEVVTFNGHAVVNVLPAGAPNKGDALRTLCQRMGLRLAVYTGDDRTDEEVFRSGAVEVGIRVGSVPDSAAGYFVRSQPEVDDLLRTLIAARVRADGFTGSCDGVLRALKTPAS